MVRDNEYQKSSVEYGGFVEAPEEDYERRMAIEEARRALDKIKEPMRSCLLLKQQGLSYREIATTFVIERDERRQFGGAWPERVCEGLRENRRQMMRQCLDEAMLQSYFDGELSTQVDGKCHVASGFMCDLCGGRA